MAEELSYARFTIPYPRSDRERKAWNRRFGLNAYYAGKHWSERKDDATFWHAMTRSALARQGMTKWKFTRPVQITFRWNDGLDIENHAAMGKMITDALKGLLIPDDNRKWLVRVVHEFHEEKFIEVEVMAL